LNQNQNQNQKHRKVGRPRLPKGEAKGKIVPVRLAENEARAFTKAAKGSKKTLSEWIRGTLNAKIAAQ